MDAHQIESTAAGQAGVISRRQVLALDGDDVFIERQLRRQEWAQVHRGVYVNHTGPLSWTQRAWAAVLYYWPAALSHGSSLHVHGLRTAGEDELINIAVDPTRRVRRLPGVRLHRVSRFADVVQPNRSPARIRLEHSLLDVAAEAETTYEAIAVLADACQRGRTTPRRLADTLSERPRLPRRRLLLEILEDVASGVYSVLEHRYLTKVERPHGLPRAKRQRRVKPGRSAAYRDVEYVGLATVVELDGRLGHEAAGNRWEDLDRDIDSVILGDVTLRLGWKQVEEPCRTAIRVGRLLKAQGWRERLTPCSQTCPIRDVGVLPAPAADDAPTTGQQQAG